MIASVTRPSNVTRRTLFFPSNSKTKPTANSQYSDALLKTFAEVRSVFDCDPSLQSLFVPQGLDRIEARGAEGRHHAADQSHGAENQRGGDQRSRSDNQADVTRFSVLGESTVQRKPSHGKRDRISQYHSQHAANKSNRERFREELHQDVSPGRAQRLLHPNLARALCNGNQHDIHQADAADSKRKRSNKTHQHLQPESNNLELMDLGHQVEYFHGLAIGLIELVLGRHNRADRLFQQFVFRSLVRKPDGIQVMRILQIAHRAEGDVHHPVYIVIALLHFGFQDADDFEAEAVHPDVLPQRVASGEQFFLGLRTDHRHAGALDLVFQVVEASLSQLECADIHHVGIVAGDGPRENPRVVLDTGLLAGFGCDMRDLGKIGSERVYIIQSKADEHSRFLTAGLHGSAARNHDDQLRTEIGKDVRTSLAKTISISEQHDHGGDAPSHAQHSERSAAAIVPHGAVGFLEQITKHIGPLLA